MKQLELSLTPKLSYDAEAFILHSGVKAAVDAVRDAIARDLFSVFYIAGAARSGKSHFAVHISAAAAGGRRTPVFIEGKDLDQNLQAAEIYDFIVVDDIDNYFFQPAYSHSGPFVHFVEQLRMRNTVLVLLSRKSRLELPVDDHVASRLAPGEGYFINAPAEEEVPQLLSAMALQRGIMLKDRQQKFIFDRVSRDIGSIEMFLNHLREISTGQDRAMRYSMLRKALSL